MAGKISEMSFFENIKEERAEPNGQIGKYFQSYGFLYFKIGMQAEVCFASR
jgi:hypothetical protein